MSSGNPKPAVRPPGEPRYRALVLDLDGTIVGDDGRIHPRTRSAIRTAADHGVHVMIATGRSEPAAAPVLAELELTTEAVVYNGAAVYCPREDRLVHETHLSRQVCDVALDYSEQHGHLPVVMVAGTKHARTPRTEAERMALHDMHNLEVVPQEQMRVEGTIRISLFSSQHASSTEFKNELETLLPEPAFLTHFPLNCLPAHHDSNLKVLDIQPACNGKAVALEYLEDKYGIPRAQVVAIGDAGNDLLMLEHAGLGVCMEAADDEVRAVSDRVIGHCESDTVACLIEELFLDSLGS